MSELLDLPDELLVWIAGYAVDNVTNLRLVNRRFAHVSHETFVNRFIRTRRIFPCWGQSLPDFHKLISNKDLGLRVWHVIVCPISCNSVLAEYHWTIAYKLLLDILKILAVRKQEVRLSITRRVKAVIPSSKDTRKKLELRNWSRNDNEIFWHYALELTRPFYLTGYYPKELSIDAGRNTTLANVFFVRHDLTALASNLRALDLGVLYAFPGSPKADLADMRHLLIEARCLEKLSLRLGWVWTDPFLTENFYPAGLNEALEALVGGVTMPHLLSLELPKGLWHRKPLLEFIYRHSKTLTTPRLINVDSFHATLPAESLQEAFNTLKPHFPANTLTVEIDHMTAILDRGLGLEYVIDGLWNSDDGSDSTDEDNKRIGLRQRLRGVLKRGETA
ncbi:hypothetical protein MBLNU457_g0911t1 [Dothideomycetes sp. NU457]